MNSLLFGKSKKSTQFIARTGILLALTIAMQYVCATYIKAQLITGSVVNAFLIIAAGSVGIVGAGLIGLFTPILGFLTGVVGNILLTPFIGLANACFVIVYALLINAFKVDYKKGLKDAKNIALGVSSYVLGAGAKFLFMFFVCLKLILPLVLPQIAPPIEVAFGITQLWTALIGGTIGFITTILFAKTDVI